MLAEKDWEYNNAWKQRKEKGISNIFAYYTLKNKSSGVTEMQSLTAVDKAEAGNSLLEPWSPAMLHLLWPWGSTQHVSVWPGGVMLHKQVHSGSLIKERSYIPELCLWCTFNNIRLSEKRKIFSEVASVGSCHVLCLCL